MTEWNYLVPPAVPKVINYFWLSVAGQPNFIKPLHHWTFSKTICKIAQQDNEWKFMLWVDNNPLYFQDYEILQEKLIVKGYKEISRDGWDVSCKDHYFSSTDTVTVDIRNINDNSNFTLSKELNSFQDRPEYLGVRIDISRYEVLFHKGGVAFDLDTSVFDVNYLNQLIYEYHFFSSANKLYSISINSFGIVPEHPLLKYIVNSKSLEIIATYNKLCSAEYDQPVHVAECMIGATAWSLGVAYIKYKLEGIDKASGLTDLVTIHKEGDYDLEYQCHELSALLGVHNQWLLSEKYLEVCPTAEEVFEQNVVCASGHLASGYKDQMTWLYNAFPE